MNNTLLILIVVLALVSGAISWTIFLQSRGAKSAKTSQGATRFLHSDRTQSSKTSHFPPTPKENLIVSVDIPRTIQTFAYYTDSKRVFAVFSYGTCVLLPDGSKDAEKEAKEILEKVYLNHPDFTPCRMDDGQFLVRYWQPAFSVVFKEEFEFDDDLVKIGLFGRSRMFLDAQTPVIVQIWIPQV